MVEKAANIGVEHEYTELEVNEISIVDLPANMKNFAVIKSTNDSAQKGDKVSKNAEGKDAEVKKDDDDISKFMESVEQLSDLVKGVGEQVKEANEKIDAQKSNDKELDEKEVKKEKVQVVESEKEEPEIKDANFDETSFVENLGSIVLKAKAFTPKRIEKLKEMYSLMTKVMEDLEIIPSGQSPKNKLPGNAKFGQTGLAPIMKAVEKISCEVSKIVETQKALSEKVERIEKARRPSTSLGDDNVVTKKNNDFWSGTVIKG